MTVEKAAEKVLGEAQAPMHYTEITEEIQNQGLWKSGGETPPQSVNGCLNTKIRDDPENCLWERVGYRTGMFRLKRPASRVKTTHGGGSRQQPNRKTRGASFARSIAKSAIKRGTRMKDWEEFLKKCDSEVRRYFGKAKTLAEKAGYQVEEANIEDAFAIRLFTPNQTPVQTFFARLAAPNKLHFCFDRLVKKRGFSNRKKQGLIGYLQDKGFERNLRRGAEEVVGVLNEAALDIFEYVLDEVAAELKLGSAGSRRPGARGGTGEGTSHKTLKEYIRANPLSVGIKLKGTKAEIEKNLPSGDRIDVSFENRTFWIGVANDHAPIMPPFMSRVCWGYGPVWTGLQTPVGSGRRGSYGAARCWSRAASAR